MEIQPGIHRLESRVGPRYLFQHMLVGERILLVDSGMAHTPQEVIFPYLRSMGYEPTRIDYLLITHPDSDHFGGNAEIREAAPRAFILCGHADRRMIENPDVLLRERCGRYERDHEIAYSTEDKQRIARMAGKATAVDISLVGGEEISLAQNWRVRALLTPGHSHGHLTVYDDRSQTGIIGDAVLWRGIPEVGGEMMLPPSYILPSAYLATIQMLENLPLKFLLTSHYRALQGNDIKVFFQQSREFCLSAEQLLVDLLAHSGTPLTLKEIIAALNPQLGPFHSQRVLDLAYPLEGHIGELVRAGRIEELRSAPPVSYRLRADARPK